jgi:hypothetical protein
VDVVVQPSAEDVRVGKILAAQLADAKSRSEQEVALAKVPATPRVHVPPTEIPSPSKSVLHVPGRDKQYYDRELIRLRVALRAQRDLNAPALKRAVDESS